MRSPLRSSLLLTFALAFPLRSAVAPGPGRTAEETFSIDVMLHVAAMIPADADAGGSTFQGRCSRAADSVMTFTFEGNSAPFGNIKGWAEHCSRVITRKTMGDQTVPDSVRYEDGRMFVVTLAGDTLRGVYGNGVSTLTAAGQAAFRDDFALFGGTGRFDLATGSGSESGLVIIGQPSPLHSEGKIRYRRAPSAN